MGPYLNSCSTIVQLLVLLVCSLLCIVHAQKKDATKVPKTFGKDVTEAVLYRLQNSKLFPNDHDFLRRIAHVETAFGTHSKTYRPNYFGGIWQVDEDLFDKTKSKILSLNHERINKKFGINWLKVEWKDLLKPLYSGLAARLYFLSLNTKIPDGIMTQGRFWKENYRPNESPMGFSSLVIELEATPECQGKMDICIVLDGSGSIGHVNFELAKKFVADLVSTFSLDRSNGRVRVAFIVYGNNASVVFDFDNLYTKRGMNDTILGIAYPSEDTNTPAGLLLAYDLYNKTLFELRPGVPRLVVTLTDGVHNRGDLAAAIETIHSSGLISFAVGIGSEETIEEKELRQIALGKDDNVFRVTNFDALAEFLYKLNSAACHVPQAPQLETKSIDSLAENEKRVYSFVLPESGITITVSESIGKAIGYYSYSMKNPNSAVHDGIIKHKAFIPAKQKQNRSSKGRVRREISEEFEFHLDENEDGEEGNFYKTVYVTIEGVFEKPEDGLNNKMGNATVIYSLSVSEGYHIEDGDDSSSLYSFPLLWIIIACAVLMISIGIIIFVCRRNRQ